MVITTIIGTVMAIATGATAVKEPWTVTSGLDAALAANLHYIIAGVFLTPITIFAVSYLRGKWKERVQKKRASKVATKW